MSLYDTANEDAEDILGDSEGFSVPVLITDRTDVTYGTLDPQDLINQIRGFMGDHYTQLDLESGIPQAGLNAKVTISLKTLLDKGVIADTVNLDFTDYKFFWLDPVSGNQRDFLVNRIHPTRSLGHIIFILGEIEITP